MVPPGLSRTTRRLLCAIPCRNVALEHSGGILNSSWYSPIKNHEKRFKLFSFTPSRWWYLLRLMTIDLLSRFEAWRLSTNVLRKTRSGNNFERFAFVVKSRNRSLNFFRSIHAVIIWIKYIAAYCVTVQPDSRKKRELYLKFIWKSCPGKVSQKFNWCKRAVVNKMAEILHNTSHKAAGRLCVKLSYSKSQKQTRPFQHIVELSDGTESVAERERSEDYCNKSVQSLQFT